MPREKTFRNFDGDRFFLHQVGNKRDMQDRAKSARARGRRARIVPRDGKWGLYMNEVRGGRF